MDALARSIAHTLPRDPRTDPDIIADCEDILDASLAWSRGELPLNHLMQLGTIEDHHGRPSPRYSRWVAMATAKSTDPRRRALLDALDVVVAAQVIVTRFGVFDQREIHESDANVQRANVSRDPWTGRRAA